MNDTASATRLLLVSGLSGAGKSTALKALEDLNYEAVDNLPMSLMASLLRPGRAAAGPLAVGIDIRTRDFAVGTFLNQLDQLLARGDLDVGLIFLDCDDDMLQRRFTETRRRHPLAADRPVADGIRHERRLMYDVRQRADLVIDTSLLTLADLRRLLAGHFSTADEAGLMIAVTSFSYRRGLPREADLVFDVRFLANPHYNDQLRPLTGQDPAVGAFIDQDPHFEPFFDRLSAMLLPLLPRFENEGKSYLTIAVGCTGGRHRSVYVAERLAALLAEQGHPAQVRHRDIDAGAAPGRAGKAGR